MKKILYFILLLSLFVCGFEAKAQFYIFEPGTGASGMFQVNLPAVYTAGTTNPQIDQIGSGWIRLTPDEGTKMGYTVLDRTFPSSMGVTVEFDFKVWGTASMADGFCVFLIDASTAFSHGGASGGGLGFASTNGLNGAKPTYLGVGIDEYGNFSKSFSGNTPPFLPGGIGQVANSIAIRTGSMHPTESYQYHYLSGATLPTGVPIAVYGATRPADVNYYRRVRVRFEPVGEGVRATVELKTQAMDYFTLFSYDYTGGPLFVARPSVMKVGFSASTGGSRAVHEVRNVIIRTPGVLQVFKSMSDCPELNQQAAIKTSIACYTASQYPVAVKDTLPAGYVVTGDPSISGGTFVSTPSITDNVTPNGTGKVYSYTVNMLAQIAEISYNGSFTSMPTGGVFSTSAGLTKPTGFPTDIPTSDLILYAKHTGALKRAEAVSPAVGALVYQYGVAQTFDVNGGNLVWTYSTDNGTNWRYAGTGSPFTPPAHLFKEPSFMLRCVSGKGSCVSAPLTYNCALNIEPVVVLMDSCSRQPYLAVRHDYAGATYKWFRSANGNNGWTEINGETRRRLNVTDEAYYKVQVEYGNAAGESAKLHFITVKKQNIYGGSVWYISRSER